MLDTVVSFLWPEAMAAHCFLHDDESKYGKQTSFYIRDMVYETKDGKFITAGAVSDAEWKGLCQALGKDSWITDERFKTAVRRMKNANLRFEMTENAIKEFDAATCLKRLADHDVPSAFINHPRSAILHDEQIKANDLIVETEHSAKDIGGYRFCRPPARFYSPENIQISPSQEFITTLKHSPSTGEDTVMILKKFCGLSDHKIKYFMDQGIVKGTSKL